MARNRGNANNNAAANPVGDNGDSDEAANADQGRSEQNPFGEPMPQEEVDARLDQLGSQSFATAPPPEDPDAEDPDADPDADPDLARKPAEPEDPAGLDDISRDDGLYANPTGAEDPSQPDAEASKRKAPPRSNKPMMTDGNWHYVIIAEFDFDGEQMVVVWPKHGTDLTVRARSTLRDVEAQG